MSELLVELSDGAPQPRFDGPTDNLVAFLSFAAAARYGSVHPLSTLANRLRRERKVDMGPLWEFYEADPEDDLDRAQLDRIWQDPGPLRDSAAAAAAAIRTELSLHELTAGFPMVPALLDRLAEMATDAASRGVRVRLLYRL